MRVFVLILLAITGFSASVSAAEMVFHKQGDPTIVLSIGSESAKIYKRQYYIDVNVGETFSELDELDSLVSGVLNTDSQTNDLRIERPEGDVCPDVKIYLLHDVVDGENQGALVRTDDGGTASRYCSSDLVNGQYVREQ